LENDTHSFVIRIWHEAVDDDGKVALWRGSIQHVASGQRQYFHDFASVVRFIQKHVEIKKRRRVSWWRRLLGRFPYEIP
jgi:hypothetical protein